MGYPGRSVFDSKAIDTLTRPPAGIPAPPSRLSPAARPKQDRRGCCGRAVGAGRLSIRPLGPDATDRTRSVRHEGVGRIRLRIHSHHSPLLLLSVQSSVQGSARFFDVFEVQGQGAVRFFRGAAMAMEHPRPVRKADALTIRAAVLDTIRNGRCRWLIAGQLSPPSSVRCGAPFFARGCCCRAAAGAALR